MAETPERTAAKPFERITFDPEVMGDRARIRGMRVTAAIIVDQIAEVASIDDGLANPDLERENGRQALVYAASPWHRPKQCRILLL
jgi:uncharacterized protein (DUF433 family)